jgi:protein TilB
MDNIVIQLFKVQAHEALQQQLAHELVDSGVDVEKAARVENDGLDYDPDADIEDPGYIDPADGQFKRPWCPATRILEHRENERIER